MYVLQDDALDEKHASQLQVTLKSPSWIGVAIVEFFTLVRDVGS
jgi:hypothetical protein